MRKIVCLCENSFEINFPEEIDLEKEEGVIDGILDGSFMTVRCPKCESELKPELPFRLVDASRGLDIFFIPETDRSGFMLNKLEYELNNPARVVIGYKELVEKLTIITAGLDDRVIEILKYYILSKAQSVEHAADINIFFIQQNDDKMVFHIEGIKEGEIAQYDLKSDVYSKVEKDIDKKESDSTYKTFLQPPYVSLNKVYME